MMPRARWTGWASIALGLGVAANAIAGPLVLNVMRPRVSVPAINQLLGGELVSLLIAAPLALAAGTLILRVHRLGHVLAMGPALYAVYTYTQFVVGPQYERYPGNNEYYFPLYLVLVVLGWLVALGAWLEIQAEPQPALSLRLRRALGTLLVSVNGMFALAWFASIADILDGSPSAEYELDQTLFWLIRLMDLGFVIPVGIMIGAGLLMGRSWTLRVAPAFCGVQVLLGCAVTGMGVVMTLRDDPAASLGLLLFTSVVSAALIAVYWQLLRAVAGESAQSGGAVHGVGAHASGFS